MLKPVAWRELVRRLRAFGFTGPDWGTKHPFMVRGSLKLHIPRDHGSDIGAPLLSEILRQAGIRRDEWNRTA